MFPTSVVYLRYDEDYSVERLYMLMMRFPLLAGEYAEFVDSNPCFGLIVEKCCNEKATKLLGLPFKPQRNEMPSQVPSTRVYDFGIRDVSLVKAYRIQYTRRYQGA